MFCRLLQCFTFHSPKRSLQGKLALLMAPVLLMMPYPLSMLFHVLSEIVAGCFSAPITGQRTAALKYPSTMDRPTDGWMDPPTIGARPRDESVGGSTQPDYSHISRLFHACSLSVKPPFSFCRFCNLKAGSRGCCKGCT